MYNIGWITPSHTLTQKKKKSNWVWSALGFYCGIRKIKIRG